MSQQKANQPQRDQSKAGAGAKQSGKHASRVAAKRATKHRHTTSPKEHLAADNKPTTASSDSQAVSANLPHPSNLSPTSTLQSGATITSSNLLSSSTASSNLSQLIPSGTTLSSVPSAASKASISSSTLNSTSAVNEEYKLLLSPMFSAMTKITDNLFLTGVGGMTRENFRKNHIDFVVNITTEAPFWEDVESMRLPLEDDTSANILPYLDTAVDRINEAISRRNAHVLVHCVAGVSRSTTVVIAYLMKWRRMDLKQAFNYCYNLRPVIRPNNGFMLQLMNYEQQLFNKSSVRMVDVDVDGTLIMVPHFFVEEHPRLVLLEVLRVRDQAKQQAAPPTPPSTNATASSQLAKHTSQHPPADGNAAGGAGH